MRLAIFTQPRFGWPSTAPNVLIRPPAELGDIAECVARKFTHILFLDGRFLDTQPPNHLEILLAIKTGVQVVGASSMGALRAAELDSQGMKGLGVVYSAIKEGLIDDDGEVALAYDSKTFQPVSIPLVNIRRLLKLAIESGLSEAEAGKALRLATKVYFLERTWKTLQQVWAKECLQAYEVCKTLSRLRDWDVKGADSRYAVSVVCGLTAVLARARLSPEDLLW